MGRSLSHEPRDPAFDARVRASFGRQPLMATLGATITHVAAGEVDIALPFDARFTQQHGFLHAGIVTSAVDTACGYAALTLMEPGAAVLSVEFKLNMLAPASGTHFRATGRVLRAGRTITVCAGELFAIDDQLETSVAVMQATIMTVRDRPALVD
ncbi:MAG: thioesterase family protein [Gemmatimonadetes bacterium]|nr:thioesterase family protein [Gemmatimonadota bacterium]